MNDLQPALYEDTSDYDKDPDRFIQWAKQFVVGAHAVETSDTGEPELTVEDLYVTWFAKTLDNWKALVSTSISGDGLYFEVTHNGEKMETYVDTYRKSSNHVFSHHDF